MLTMKKLADERNPGATSFDKEAFLGTAARGIGTVARSGYHALRSGVQGAGLSRAMGGGLGESLKRGAGDAAAAFRQHGGAGMIKRNPVKFGLGAAAATGAAGYGVFGGGDDPREKRGSVEQASIPIGKFLSPEQLHTIKTAGLHKVVAAVEKVASGRNVDTITIDSAVHLLGEKAFIKRAERRRISMGLAALGKVLEA